MNLPVAIATKLALPVEKVKNTIELLEDKNTIPFIARYRKEITGNLDEVEISNISEALERLLSLENRREAVLLSIESQGKLTEALRHQILQADTLTHLEDLYQPYRPKRRTRAMIAREKGLEPLAAMILEQTITQKTIEALVAPFLSDDVADADAAISGASDIVAEVISENAIVRNLIREKGWQRGKLTSTLRPEAKDERQTFSIYYQFEILVKSIRPHQVLAINRGETENVLKVAINFNEQDWRTAIWAQYPPDKRSLFYEILLSAGEDSAKRLLLPTIERDIRRTLNEKAEEHAIEIFAKNLRGLLTQAPLSGQVVLAIDPGFRTGSKVAVVDQTGKLLDTGTIYPHPPQKRADEAYQIINRLIAKHQVTLIAIGNGTASRETEAFVAELTKSNPNLSYLITSEAGASVYSASSLARKEFPDLDVSIRGAVSIARRVQDPLAELVKIDPKSIGVGLYQHDINQSRLSDALNQVVGSVVNAVGVDINTASAPLLTHVAGIGPSLAEKIVQHREDEGRFENREEIKRVSGMGPKSFEQSAGFLRVNGGSNALDATAIHPESYPSAVKLFELLKIKIDAALPERIAAVAHLRQTHVLKDLANKLKIGLPTLEDILGEIVQPGRDPREDMPKPLLRKDVLHMEDLVQGMALKGTIRNVVDFGAFVDIGLKTDGLLHQSKIKHGTDLKVGEIIDVIVLSIDQDRNRIALDMKEK